MLAVALATLGVLIVSLPPAASHAGLDRSANWRAAGYGLSAAATFGLATVGFREGILALGGSSFVIAATAEPMR